MPAVAREAGAAGPRVRVPRTGGAAPDGRAVRRRDRLDHRRVERRAGVQGRPRAARRSASCRSRRSRPRRACTRASGERLDDSDARARPADSRSGHVRALRRRDDAAGARAGERRVLTAGCSAARGGCSASWRPTRRAATRGRGRPHRVGEPLRRRHLAARRGSGCSSRTPARTRRTRAAGVGRGGAGRPVGTGRPGLADAGRRRRPARRRRAGGHAARQRRRHPRREPVGLVYDIAGRGFTRFRGMIGVENARTDIGATLNPALRFFVFDAEPNRDRLLPPARRAAPGPAGAHDRRRRRRSRLLARARPRAAAAERRAAEAALRDPARRKPAVRRRAWRICCGRC